MGIKTTSVVGNELHVTYPRQTSPQPCYVELDAREEGKLSAAANPEIGNGVPFDVVHGHVQRWTIPALRASAANKLLAKIAPLADRVVADYSSAWNGSNHVGSYTDDAQSASEAIRDLCDRADGEDDTIVTWTASDWFGGIGGEMTQAKELDITAETTDEQLVEIAKREVSAAQSDNVDELDGIEEHLRYLRKTVQDEAA